jgi:hypothetical protein
MIYKSTKTAEKYCWYVFVLQGLAQKRFALNKPHELFAQSKRSHIARPHGTSIGFCCGGRQMRPDFSLSSPHRTPIHGMIVGTSLDERPLGNYMHRNKLSVSLSLKHEQLWRTGGLEASVLRNLAEKVISFLNRVHLELWPEHRLL